MNKYCFCIDIGSKNIRIASQSMEVLVDEPNVVAMQNQNKSYEAVAFGKEVYDYCMENPSSQLVYPIKNGIVYDANALVAIISHFFDRIVKKTIFKKPYISVIVGLSCGLTNIEKRAVEEVLSKCGAKEIVIVESPICASTIFDGNVKFLVDIGASKTEIAIVSDNGIIAGCSIDIGGDSIDNAITDYVSDKYRLLISPKNSEEIKCKLGSLVENDMSTITIKGKAVFQNSVSDIKISALELKPVIEGEVDKIIEVVEQISLMIPEVYAESVLRQGFYFIGGSMHLQGLKEYLERKLCIKVIVPEFPELSVAKGGAKFFYDKVRLEKMLNVENFDI